MLVITVSPPGRRASGQCRRGGRSRTARGGADSKTSTAEVQADQAFEHPGARGILMMQWLDCWSAPPRYGLFELRAQAIDATRTIAAPHRRSGAIPRRG